MTEVTENEVQTISMNDKEYKVDELSDKARYLVSQVQDMQTQANQARARLDQIEVGIRGFTGLLQEELENPAPAEGEGELVQQNEKGAEKPLFFMMLYNRFLRKQLH